MVTLGYLACRAVSFDKDNPEQDSTIVSAKTLYLVN
jgi:hypothetical protein